MLGEWTRKSHTRHTPHHTCTQASKACSHPDPDIHNNIISSHGKWNWWCVVCMNPVECCAFHTSALHFQKMNFLSYTFHLRREVFRVVLRINVILTSHLTSTSSFRWITKLATDSPTKLTCGREYWIFMFGHNIRRSQNHVRSKEISVECRVVQMAVGQLHTSIQQLTISKSLHRIE